MIDRGDLSGDTKGLPVQAKGYYLLEGELEVKSIADVGILDGFIVLELAQAERRK